MALEAQKIDREDSTSFESVLIDDKTQNSSNIVFHSDIILTEEAKVFKEQKNKEKNRCFCNDFDCFSCSFWCCFFDDCCNCCN